MLRNGIRSAGTKSRHIDIRFFGVSDRLKQEKMSLEYCPTEHMLGDFFTKPLQGKQFSDMRDIVLGHKTKLIFDEKNVLKSKERKEPDLKNQKVQSPANLPLVHKERIGKTVFERYQLHNKNMRENKIPYTDTNLVIGERPGMPSDNDEETVAISNVTNKNDEGRKARTNDENICNRE